MNEEWKDIPGYEGLYQASTLGRIRTCEGKTTSNARFPSRIWKQRIMKQKVTKNGKGRSDARVELWNGNNHKTWLVARLIALTWCDGYQESMTVNHINGNHLDNRKDNLEWLPLGDNIRLGFKDGLYSTQKECVLVSNSGKELMFDSYSNASLWLGKSKHYISCCKCKGKLAVYKDGCEYTLITQ